MIRTHPAKATRDYSVIWHTSSRSKDNTEKLMEPIFKPATTRERRDAGPVVGHFKRVGVVLNRHLHPQDMAASGRHLGVKVTLPDLSRAA